MLDTFAPVVVQVFLNLRLVVGGFVDRDPNIPIRARHRARLEPCELSLDVEIADLAEIEELLVKAAPACFTRTAVAQAEGPCAFANRLPWLSASALTTKSTPPCRKRVTALER